MTDPQENLNNSQELSPTEWLRNLVATMPSAGNRLTFHRRCGAFYALQQRTPRPIVEKMYGISSATSSMLANCLDATSTHYKDVASEFRRLGWQEFGFRYFGDEERVLLNKARYNVMQARNAVGPNPRAHKFAFGNFGKFRDADGDYYRIDWLEPVPPRFERPPTAPGWYFTGSPDGDWTDREPDGWTDSSGDEHPFRTSGKAYAFILKRSGLEVPRHLTRGA